MSAFPTDVRDSPFSSPVHPAITPAMISTPHMFPLIGATAFPAPANRPWPGAVWSIEWGKEGRP